MPYWAVRVLSFGNMQKSALRSVLAVSAIGCIAFSSSAMLGRGVQNPTSANAIAQVSEPVTMPKDPKALMLLGVKVNSFTSDDTKPWHLRASYTITDDLHGITKEQGTFEEYWAGPDKQKITFTVGNESVTTFRTSTGVFKIGKLNKPDRLASELGRELVDPLPMLDYLNSNTFELHTVKNGSAKVKCVVVQVDTTVIQVGAAPVSYCFDEDKPILRIDTSDFGANQTVRNAAIAFQGKYIPKQVQIATKDKLTVIGNLTSLGLLTTIANADFTPPPGAEPLPSQIELSSREAALQLIKNYPPHYPIEAKRASISGTVVIKTRIGLDGYIHDAEVISGPQQLRDAALACLKQWVYRPYLLDGQPVEVNTQINIIFNIGS